MMLRVVFPNGATETVDGQSVTEVDGVLFLWVFEDGRRVSRRLAAADVVRLVIEGGAS